MKLYQDRIQDYYRRKPFAGKPEGTTNSAMSHNPLCGDVVILNLVIAENRVKQAGVQAEGCVLSVASAHMISEQIIGKSLQELNAFNNAWVQQLIGLELGPNRLRCATLSLACIQSILKDVNA